MRDLFIGTSAYPQADESLLNEVGIGWIRQGFPIPDCPAETVWGLADIQGKPKLAFYAFREGVIAI